MKQILTTLAFGFLCMQLNAQTATLESAQELVKNNDYVGARKAIDEVTSNSVNTTGQAWFTKAYVYQKLAEDPRTKSVAPTAQNIALDAYKKYVATEKKLDVFLAKDNVMSLIGNLFNNGVQSYNDKKYNEAIAQFDNVLDFKNSETSAKLFPADKTMDTIAAQSKLYKAYSYYNDKKYTDCISLFEEVASSPITKDADIFLRLSNIYQMDGNYDKMIGIVQKGLTSFPNNSDLKIEEINYYLLTNKTEELIKKLEDATTKDAKNASLLFSLATSYSDLLRSKKPGLDLSNTRKKAVVAYEKCALMDSKNGDYQYNLAAIYFNQAVEANDFINKNKEDKTAVETGKKDRDLYLSKALPYLEKSVALYEAGGVKEADKQNFQNAKASLEKAKEIMAKAKK